jgi:Tfp pilus assembly protein PilN
MTRIAIDFAPRGWQRTLRRLSPLWYVLLGLSGIIALAAAVLGYRVYAHEHARQALAERIEQREAARARANPPVKPIAIPVPQANAINAIAHTLNLPWRELRDAFDACAMPNVALLSLAPDVNRHSVRVTAETTTPDDMIVYLRTLREQPFFSDVQLTHHEINEQDINRPIRFQLETVWVAH